MEVNEENEDYLICDRCGYETNKDIIKYHKFKDEFLCHICFTNTGSYRPHQNLTYIQFAKGVNSLIEQLKDASSGY